MRWWGAHPLIHHGRETGWIPAGIERCSAALCEKHRSQVQVLSAVFRGAHEGQRPEGKMPVVTRVLAGRPGRVCSLNCLQHVHGLRKCC